MKKDKKMTERTEESIPIVFVEGKKEKELYVKYFEKNKYIILGRDKAALK